MYYIFSGWEQPNWFALEGDLGGYRTSFRRGNWFEPVGRECKMVMENAGIIDLSPFGKFDISGPDAHIFLDMLCANAVPKVIENDPPDVITLKHDRNGTHS